MNGRRGFREEGDDRSGARIRTHNGSQDFERRSKRDGDNEREGSRWESKDRPRTGYTNQRGEREWEGERDTRRKWEPRGRGEGSWLRDEDAARELDDDRRGTNRYSGRRTETGGSREWTRGVKLEQDPAWMESTGQEEELEPLEGRKQAHTAEDFQRWKESMKAGKSVGDQIPIESEREPEPESRVEPPEPPMIKQGVAFPKDETPYPVGGLDKFFGLWGNPGESGKMPESDQGILQKPAFLDADLEEPVPQKAQSKAPKASRFAAMFGAPEQVKTPLTEMQQPAMMSPAPPKADNKEDREAFQRILQMLGGGGGNPLSQQSPSGFPEMSDDASRPTRSSNERVLQAQKAMASPQNDFFPKIPKASPFPGSQQPMARKSTVSESQPPQSPRHDQHSRVAETNTLLELMRGTGISTPSQHQQQQSTERPKTTGPPPGFSMPENVQRPPSMQKQKPPPGLFNDPAIANFGRMEPEPRQQMPKRDGNGFQPGFFDEPPYPGAMRMNKPPQQSNIQQRPQHQQQQQQQQGSQLPSNAQRPPSSFEQGPPPPPWAREQYSGGVQHPTHMNPPPGFQTQLRNDSYPPGIGGGGTGRRGTGPGPGPGPGMPPPHPPPPGWEAPNFPPMNGPPPGFGPTPAHHGPMMGIPGPGHGQFGNGPQGDPRQLMEMFGQAGTGFGGGTGGPPRPPPGYR